MSEQNDASKLVVGQVRVHPAVGPITVLCLYGTDVWMTWNTSEGCTFSQEQVLSWPLKRKVPVLEFDLHPWEVGITRSCNAWYILSRIYFYDLMMPREYAPPAEPEGTTYTREELMQARKEVGK